MIFLYILFIFYRNIGAKKIDEFQKRCFYGTYIIFFMIILLVARLIYIQVIESKYYKKKIDSQIQKEEKIYGSRGKIYDTNGKNLVFNKNLYTIAINPSLTYNERVMNGVKAILNEKFIIKNRFKLLKEVKYGLNHNRKYKIIAKDISQNDMDKVDKIIRKYRLKQNEIMIESTQKRIYFRNEIYGNILGFIGKNNSTKQKIGLFGLEKEYENYLHPRTIKRINMYANHKKLKLPMSKSFMQINSDGDDIYLTIDNEIEIILNEELEKKFISSHADGAYGIIMDPQNGKILAISSFVKKNKFHRNPIFQNQYEPGSTFKPIIVASALNSGLISPQSTFDVGDGQITKYNHTIRESSHSTRGIITTEQVLTKSSNVGMVLISDRFKNKNFEDYLKKFGLYDKTGVDFPNELKPFTQSYNKWNGLKKNTMAFGQGIVVTPIQLITALSAVINGGKLYKPYLVQKVVNSDGVIIKRNIPICKREVIDPNISKIVRDMLENVVKTGTGKKGQVEGYRIGGKTGTAQIGGRGGYIKDNYLSSFVGFFPADEPEYIALIMLLKPKGESMADKYGGSVAAPVFSQIASRIIRYKNILSHNVKILNTPTDLKIDRKESINTSIMPDLTGLTPQDVIMAFPNREIEVVGSGLVVNQAPLPNENLDDVKKIKIYLK